MIAQMALLLSAMTVLGATPGKPPSADEERLFAEGMKAWQAGDAAAAERAWSSGYEAGRDPAFLVRIGEAQEKQGRAADAAASYRRYVQAAPDAADRAEIEERIRRIAPQAPPQPVDPGETPGELGGSAPAPGHLPPRSAAPTAAPEQVADVGRDAPGAGERQPASRLLIVAGAVSVVAAVALAITAGAFGAAASGKSGDVSQLITYADQHTGLPKEYAGVRAGYEEAVDDGKRYDRYAKGFAIAAASSAALGAVLLGIGYGMGPRAAEPSVALAPGGASAGLTWRF